MILSASTRCAKRSGAAGLQAARNLYFGPFETPSGNDRYLREAAGCSRRIADVADCGLGRLSWADSGPTRLTRESTLLPALRHCKPSFKKAGAHALRRPRLAVRIEPTRPRTRAALKHLNAQGSRRRALRRRRSRSGMLSISVRQRRWGLHSASHNCEHLRSRDRRQMVMERH